MVRIEEIGKQYNVTHKGMRYTVTISQDPDSYKFYRVLGLDVFEVEKAEPKVVKTRRKKKNVSNTESNNEHESDLNTEGEYNPE